MEVINILVDKYLNDLSKEINLMLGNKKSIGEFIYDFYFFIDEMPLEIPENIVNDIEKLNDIVSRYEPNLDKREKEPVYVGKEEVKKEAIRLLNKIDLRLNSDFYK